MNSEKFTNDETQRDTSLIHSLYVVTYPRDCVWNTRVDAQGTEKDPKVAQRSVVRSKQDSEADNPDNRGADIENASFTGTVGCPADEHGHYTGGYVWWD